RDHPAKIAGARLTKNDVALALRPSADHFLDGAHCTNQVLLLGRAEAAELFPDLPHRARFQRGEHLASVRRDGQEALTRILGRDAFADQPALLETAQHAAEVTGIDAEIAGDVGRRRATTRFDFIKDARLGERELAAQPSAL